MSEGPAWADRLPDTIRGCWQLSTGHAGDGLGWTRSEAFGALDRADSDQSPLVLDMADIYTGVEALVGAWLQSRAGGDAPVRIHTKCVPNLSALPALDRGQIDGIVHRSLRRLGLEALDLVQLHWWDFGIPGWIDALGWLDERRQAGDIKQLGVTNFDAVRLEESLDAGLPIVSNQVQLSLLDRRPVGQLSTLCEERGVSLLCYGTLAGGLLTDRWLGADWSATGDLSRSIWKYRAVLDEVGGWPALQTLLAHVGQVSSETGRSFAHVATAYARHQPGVRAAIVGLSRSEGSLEPSPSWASLEPLAPAHIALFDAALPFSVKGAVYEAERRMDGPHARLMNYELGEEA